MPWFSLQEIRDMSIAAFALVVVLIIGPFFTIDTKNLPIYLLGVVFGFLLHELAHKFVAIKLGANAYFKLWVPGILAGLILAPTGIKFLAPGAVVISAYKFKAWLRRARLSVKQIGLIALAGPLVNIVLALFFFTIPWLAPAAFVNVWLALFNLIPIPPLDGQKILTWNWSIWLILIVVSVLLVFL